MWKRLLPTLLEIIGIRTGGLGGTAPCELSKGPWTRRLHFENSSTDSERGDGSLQTLQGNETAGGGMGIETALKCRHSG